MSVEKQNGNRNLRRLKTLKKDMMFKFPQASVTHLYAGEVSVLSGNVHGGVALLVNFVQRDGLFLHELK